ncbi:MAG: protein disulfide isomerase family protein [Halobacteriaceae archaeon]
MTLDTMEPTPTFDPEANADVVDAFAALGEDVTVHVWGGDWCGDCRALLPDFGAAVAAAGIADRVVHHAVDEEKQGPGVDEYGVEYIPTIVVEREDADGEHEELARFVESEALPPARYLAAQLSEDMAAP